MEKGMVYVFTGEGKGKTSAALGTTVRALLSNWRVCWISFYKSDNWEIAEKRLGRFHPKLEMNFVGRGFYIDELSKSVQKSDVGVKTVDVNKGKVVDSAEESEHKEEAKRGLGLAKKRLKSGKYDLLVLDEINNAINDGLVELNDVLKIIDSRGKIHIVITGRDVSKEIVEVADLVTECVKIKHPYDKGEAAVKGLDY